MPGAPQSKAQRSAIIAAGKAKVAASRAKSERAMQDLYVRESTKPGPPKLPKRRLSVGSVNTKTGVVTKEYRPSAAQRKKERKRLDKAMKPKPNTKISR